MKHRKPTANKGGWDPQDMIRAVDDVLNNGISERKAAEQYHVKRSSLKRRLKEARSMPEVLAEARYAPYGKCSMKIFTSAEEKQLVEYCLRASKMGYGLSPIKLRALAYEYAAKLRKRLPHSRHGRPNPWEKNKQAGKDWVRAFLCRHKELSIRKPEATSIGRMSAFNKHNVDMFYSNVHEVLTKYKFQPNNIWNCDETGVTTVQTPEHVIAGKGERQVASVTSAERGTLVTMCNAVNASGASIPPFYIFPRVHFKEIFLRNGAPGCVGTAQSTGWMVEVTFVEWFRHFVKCVRPSKEVPALLILDNHETHMSIEFINLAAENGVVVITIPPHTSHKLQPLDISVYGPFKRLYNREIGSWLVGHPGKTVTIYDIAEISGNAWTKASMPANIISGFVASGIHPFQPDKWQDEDFCLAQVTDRPNPHLHTVPLDNPRQQGDPRPSNPNPVNPQFGGSSLQPVDLQQAVNPHPDHPSGANAQSNSSSPQNADPLYFPQPVNPQPGDVSLLHISSHQAINPEHAEANNIELRDMNNEPSTSTGGITPANIRPLPRAPARETLKKGGRKKLKSTILTNTPVKETIRAEQSARKSKKMAQLSKRERAKQAPRKKPKKSKKAITTPSTSSDDDNTDVDQSAICDDSSDDEDDDEAQASARPVRRNLDIGSMSSKENCVVCGEFGRDKELWYRCRICSYWAHEACTDAPNASRYVCDYCIDDQKAAKSTRRKI